MNHAHKHVWSKALGRLVVLAECMRGGGGKAKSCRGKFAPLLVAGAMLSMPALAGDLPSGGQVISGSAAIAVDGNAMTIYQSTDRMIANWQDFSIGADYSVTFSQPGSSSVALNRVTEQDPSRILGSLSANGQVFLVNPNGIAIGRTGSVQTGGFVASTLGVGNEDFLSGTYDFSGNGGAIFNEGNLSGGVVALIAPSVINEGTITGDTALVGGTDVLLDFDGDGLLSVEVKASDVATLVENRGLVQADGGLAVLTARGASEAMQGVVNNSGTVEAKTIANRNGRILLLGDMAHGEVQVSGTLDASAPDGGDGGFVETSAARVEIAEDARVTTLAADGETGDWLIDPTDFTVGAGGAAQTESGIGADTLSTNLASTNITLQTAETGSEPGDIRINAAVNWDAPTTLTLDAHDDIHINAPITVANSGGGLALNYGGSGYHLGAPVSFTAGSGGSFSVNGDAFTLIHDVNQLQAMGNDLGSYWDPVFYALATDIDAVATAGWNSGAGFLPIGNLDDRFSGIFDGLGHVISDLTVNRPGRSNTGLFGFTYYADIRHVGLENAQVTGKDTVGALVGRLQSGSTITQSYATGTVTGSDFVGGLVGYNGIGGYIIQSYADVAAIGTRYVGGLAGYQNSDGLIRQSYAMGSVTGANDVGGLVGAGSGPINQSFFATTDAGGSSIIGGYSNNRGEGRTMADLQQLSTFANWGGDIDVQGGTGSAWRIYDGHTTPLLRAFLTPLAVDLGDVAQSVTYNGAEQSATGSHTVIESHDAALLLGDSAYSGSGTNAGDYAIGLGGLYSTQQGYDLVINPGTLTVDKASLTVIANDDSKTYDALAYNGGNGVSYTGFVGGEDEAVVTGSLAYGGSAQGATNAGGYAIALSGLVSDNYDIGYVDGTLTIDKSAATVTANSGTVTYNGGTQSVSGFTATGLVGGEDESVLDGVTTSGGNGTNTGIYAHTASGNDENYELTFVGGSLTIDKASLTVTANDDSKTYDALAYSGGNGVSYTGFVGGEDEAVLTGSLAYGGNAQGATNAGGYVIALSGLVSDNYDIAYADGILTIDRATITHIAGITAEDRVYDGTTLATLDTSGASFAGIVAGDVLTVSGGTGAFTDKNAGTGKAINITDLAVGGADAGNYVLADDTAVTAADIAKATISAVTGIEALDKIYDGTTAAALNLSEAGFTGMVAGDVLNLASATGNFADSDTGAGKKVMITGLSLGGVDADNYTLAATTASAMADINVMVDPPMPMHGRSFGADTCIGCLFSLPTSDVLSADAGIIDLDWETEEEVE
ncbi:YDG domain-containing protein [Pelagibacterium sediminicola]|uniref:YDG domain-containing protein n=1 Tax=Pelagibacterium sediminicola TaxID=2248761 RepID=UPI000E31EE7A|nr:YDG domain-containing protein [Pelagibacterium sediminicola]